jgi:hypothetical protein
MGMAAISQSASRARCRNGRDIRLPGIATVRTVVNIEPSICGKSAGN